MEFSHFDEDGNAVMVDVSGKEITQRRALAEGKIRVSREVFEAIAGRKVKKGDVLTVAQVAGIMGTKRTAELIPMCHLLNLTNSEVRFEMNPEKLEIKAFCQVKTEGKTGVEMEALTSVTVAALAIVDMVKGVDRSARIREAKIVAKSGGRSGDWVRPEDPQD